MDESVLEETYQERLEERLIAYLSDERNISYADAMELYYNSSLADKIHLGEYGIQYLDYKILAGMI